MGAPSDVPSVGGNGGGKKCWFPFLYNGVQYDSCTDVDHGQEWCSVTANYDKDGLWGNCKSKA